MKRYILFLVLAVLSTAAFGQNQQYNSDIVNFLDNEGVNQQPADVVIAYDNEGLWLYYKYTIEPLLCEGTTERPTLVYQEYFKFEVTLPGNVKVFRGENSDIHITKVNKNEIFLQEYVTEGAYRTIVGTKIK